VGRLRCLAAGAALGAGGTYWARRKAHLLKERYRPASVVAHALDEVRAAVAEGKAAMRDRERELRSDRLA
jgi:hypothetical protein